MGRLLGPAQRCHHPPAFHSISSAFRRPRRHFRRGRSAGQSATRQRRPDHMCRPRHLRAPLPAMVAPLPRAFSTGRGGGVDGTLLHGGSVLSPSPAAAPPFHDPSEGAPSAAAQGTHPPIFYKLEFSTYDSSVDPYEQFFRGQRTLPSDRTWLASYHLTDVA